MHPFTLHISLWKEHRLYFRCRLYIWLIHTLSHIVFISVQNCSFLCLSLSVPDLTDVKILSERFGNLCAIDGGLRQSGNLIESF